MESAINISIYCTEKFICFLPSSAKVVIEGDFYKRLYKSNRLRVTLHFTQVQQLSTKTN